VRKEKHAMTAPSRTPSDSNRAAIQQLESLERAGLRVIGRAGRSGSRSQTQAVVPTTKSVEAAAPSAHRESVAPEVNVPSDTQQDTLQIIQAEVAACQRCGELASTRTQTVFGVGNPKARLCFLGEAPGADEDRQGEPFVGRAGQLLTKIIEACTLARSDDYIIGRMRGKLFSYRGISVVCTYHPAYLLRNPAAKKDVWDDMKMLLAKMGIELPKKSESAGRTSEAGGA
jgi:uracil-DNA glycosylase